MKVIESNEIDDSFGMKSLSLDEIMTIDGGLGFCFGNEGCGIRIGCNNNPAPKPKKK